MYRAWVHLSPVEGNDDVLPWFCADVKSSRVKVLYAHDDRKLNLKI